MNPRIKKIIRDLWANKTRSILVIISIAVGVFAFSSVFIANKILIEEMDRQSNVSNPAIITFNLAPFDQSLVNFIENKPGVKEAEARTNRVVKLLRQDQTSIMTLIGINDYNKIRVNKLNFELGSNSPDIDEVLIERSAQKAGLNYGSFLNFETPEGDKKKLLITGVVHDINAIPANLFPQFSVYVTPEAINKLGLDSRSNRLLIATENNIKTQDQAQGLADDLEEIIKDRGFIVQGREVRVPGEHWAKDVTQAFTLILNVVGTFSLVLSAFLVINTTTALIAREKKQIGIMKAVGGSSTQIINLYLASVAFFGVLSLFLALPIGLLLAYANLQVITGFLNVNLQNFYLPINIFLLQVAAAVLVPLLASAVPIVLGTKISVAKALNPSSAKLKPNRLSKNLSKILKGLSRPITLAAANTFNNLGRLTLTLATLVVAGVLFVSVLSVRSSLSADLDKSLKTENYDIALYFTDWYSKDSLFRQALKISDVNKVGTELTTAAKAHLVGKELNLTLTAVDPDSDFFIPQIVSGRWLDSDVKNELVVSTSLARDYPTQTRINDTLRLEIDDKIYDFKVIGTMPISQGGGENPGVYTNLKTLSPILGRTGETNTLLVRQIENSGKTQQELVTALEDALNPRGYSTAASITTDTIKQSSQGQFDFLVGFLLSMAILVAVVGGLGLMGTMSLNVLERTREIGILRGIGARDKALRQMVLVEGLTIGLLSFIITIPLSLPVSYAFGVAIGLAFVQKPLVFKFSLLGVAIWFIIVLIISALASLVPARRAGKMSVRDALSYE